MGKIQPEVLIRTTGITQQQHRDKDKSMSAKSRSSHFRAKLSQHLLQKAKGFTLIELLVVVVIVGILSAVAIPTFLNQVRRARVAEAQSGLTEVQRVSEVYRLDDGVYPSEFIDIASENDTPIVGINGTLYLNDPWTTKAPNYKQPVNDGAKYNTGQGTESTFWITTADVANKPAYKNGKGDALKCEVGLGTQVDEGNLDDGCNLKG